MSATPLQTAEGATLAKGSLGAPLPYQYWHYGLRRAEVARGANSWNALTSRNLVIVASKA